MTRDNLILYAVYFTVALLLILSRTLGGISLNVSVQPFVLPVYGVFEVTGGWIRGGVRYLESREMLLERLEGTKRENRRLRQKLHGLEQLRRENRTLRSQLNLPGKKPGTYVSAEVLYTDLSKFERTLALNKGYESGIQKGDPVLEVLGDTWVMRGQVISVSANQSVVILSSDPRFKIGVRIESITDRQFVVRGWGWRGLRIEQFPSILEEPTGRRVWTAPASTLAPEGLFLGWVRGFRRGEQSYPQAGRRLLISPVDVDELPPLLWVLVHYD